MTPKSEIDPLDLLADEFVKRLRRGETPSIEEYASRYPHVAERIREVFPALAAMEGVAAALTGDGAASAVTEVETRSLPERIGDYRILREVGRGGMGIVYEAEQESLGRHVALKVLLPEYKSRARFLERFRREARAAGRLHHTNIVPVFGVGESDDTHYFVMQFIEGVGLDQVIADVRRLRREAGQPVEDLPPAADETLSVSVAHGLLEGRTQSSAVPEAKSGPISSETSQLVHHGGYYRSAARLALQAARALDHAHGNGIVHRDVKPSNFLLDVQGNLWVTDFGLAKTEEASDLTGSHDILGTMRYMSPERFAGQPIDGRADVYALGLTLYEMLTLRPAFAEYDRIQLMRQIAQGDFRRPRDLEPNIPRDLETIVLKAAAREPKDRYRTAGSFAEDLELFLANRPIKSRRASNWEHLRRWAKRNPVVSGLSGAVALLLVAVTTISLVSNARLGRTNKDLDAKSTELGRSLQEQETLRLAAQDEAWQARIEATRAGRFSGRRGQRFEGLENLRKAMELQPGRDLLRIRNEAVGCLVLPDVEVKKEFAWPYGSINAVFTADMSKYARFNMDGKVSIRSVVDDRELFSLPSEGQMDSYSGLRFSRDGRHLLQAVSFPNSQTIWVWLIDGPKPVKVLLLDGRQGFDFSCDSTRLFSVDVQGVLWVHDLDTSRERKPDLEFRVPLGSGVGVLCNPRDPNLVLLWGPQTLTVFDLTKNKIVHTRPIPENAGVSWAAWHPDGTHYAVAGSGPFRLWVCSAENGDISATLDGHLGGGLVCWFDPAGDRLWSWEWDGHIRMWDWRAGRQIFEMNEGITLPPMIGPDGETLMAVKRGERLKLLRISSGREASRLPTTPGNSEPNSINSPVASPDGRLMVSSCEGGLAIYDLQRREVLATTRYRGVRPIRFSPDGLGVWFNPTLPFESGLYFLPLQRTGDRVRLGVPRFVAPTQGSAHFGLSDDGRVLATQASRGVALQRFPVDQESTSVFLGEQTDVRYCSVSPNGEWVISGTHGSGNGNPAVVLWNATTQQRVKELQNWGGTSAFSPDGRWASTWNSEQKVVRIWDTRTWEPGPTFPGRYGVFSPDSRFMAVGGLNPGEIRLVHVPSGDEAVRLTVPDNIFFDPGCFSPDGGKLIATGMGPNFLQEWDLFAIRRQLRPMGLDWDDSPIPERPPGATRLPPPLTVETDSTDSKPTTPVKTGGLEDPQARWVADSFLIAFQPLHHIGYSRRANDLLQMNRFDEALRDIGLAIVLERNNGTYYRTKGRIYKAMGDQQAAMTAFDRAVELDPENLAHSERANTAVALRRDRELIESSRKMTVITPKTAGWWHVLAAGYLLADEELRDLAAGLEAAETAVRLTPSSPFYRTTLGYALLENGKWEAAAKEFAESRRLRPPPNYDAANLFGLAICAQNAGEASKAREWFASGVLYKDTGKFMSEQAERFHNQIYAQAAKSLGLPPPTREVIGGDEGYLAGYENLLKNYYKKLAGEK